MATLYQLADNYRQFQDYSNDMLDSDDVTEEDIQMLIDNLDSIDGVIEDKAENIAKFIRSLTLDSEMYKGEMDRLSKRKKTTENTIERLKRYTQQMLEMANIKQVKAGVFSIRLQNNNPSVEVFDENLIPEKYREAQPDKIVKKTILDDLKLKVEIPGAKMAEVTQHLRIS